MIAFPRIGAIRAPFQTHPNNANSETGALHRNAWELGTLVMTTEITGIATVVALSMMVTLPTRAQPNRPGSPKPDPAEFAALERRDDLA